MRSLGLALALSASLATAASAQLLTPRPATPPAGSAVCGVGSAWRCGAPPAATMCSSHGRLVSGLCSCLPGWSGVSCEIADAQMCSGHGAIINGRCVCSTYWMGPSCSMAGFSLTGPLFPP